MPVATSQRRTVLSQDPEARVLPSGLKATLDTQFVCPSKARRERAGGDVPEAHRLVIGPGGEGVAIGAEGDARHPIRMSLEGAEGGAGGDVPEAHGVVIGPGGEGLAVGAEGDAPHRFVCPSKARRERAGGDVPEAHGLVIGPGGEGLAVGAEGDAPTPNSYVPRRRGGSVPVATSQRRTVLSWDPEARVLPSGLKATL